MVKKIIYNIETGEEELVDEKIEEVEVDDVVVEPSLEERLEQTEQLLQATTMAFTEYVFMQDMSDDS